MEFPDLGKHCSEKSCKKLDFLPVKCDACKEIFCLEHFNYDKHVCLAGGRKDVRVPVCPLCGEPVPTPPHKSPDQTVGEHIDQYCKSETKKIFVNRCTYNNCKKKELVPFKCPQCMQNFCLTHRLTVDHKCSGPKQSSTTHGRGNTRGRPLTSNYMEKIQGNMSEDEALARALAESIIELDSGVSTTSSVQQKEKCVLS